MEENKNSGIAITLTADAAVHHTCPAADTLQDHDETGVFFYDELYDELCGDGTCTLCRHWSEYMCTAETGNCDYDPL